MQKCQSCDWHSQVMLRPSIGLSSSAVYVNVLDCMLTRCATRSHAFPCALTATLHFQAGGSRKLLAQDPGKELSYGDVFLQSYEKCAR